MFITTRRFELNGGNIDSEPGTMSPSSFELIAHRGGSREAPENTLAAFERVNSLLPGMMVELDVQLSADGIPVVIHDDVLQRVTNGHGRVAEKTCQSLRFLDAGWWFQDPPGDFTCRYQNIRIPSLEETVSRLHRMRFLIELKGTSIKLARAVSQILQRHRNEARFILAAADHRTLRRLRRLNPYLPTCASRREVARSLLLSVMKLSFLDPMPAAVYSIPEKEGKLQVLRPELLRALQRRGKRIFVWTIDHPEEALRLRQLGVNGIITDRPLALAQALSLHGPVSETPCPEDTIHVL